MRHVIKKKPILMKTNPLIFHALVICTIAGNASAAMVAGDVIMIDFGSDAGNVSATTPQGNTIANPGNDIGAGNLVNTLGVTVSDVEFNTTVPGANVGENNGSSASSAYSAIFPDQAQNDDWFESNAGQ
ncbi:MAG: hypothetical protein ACQCXQ_00120, partial [Verrucomicrobiales bacterium]